MILQALKREAQNPKHCLDKFTLGAVGEFGRPCDARVHSEDIRRVHGVPQIQTGREQTRVRSEFAGVEEGCRKALTPQLRNTPVTSAALKSI